MRTFAGRQPFNGAFRSTHATYDTERQPPDGAFRSAHAPYITEPRTPRLRRRNGVVLLVVLSLLALFVLLGVTYTLGVSQYYNASRNNLAVGRLGDQPDVEMGAVLGSLLFDVYSHASPTYRTSLQGHSLLGDLYGIDGIAGIVNGTPTIDASTQGQFLLFSSGSVPASALFQPYNQNLTAWSPIPEYYVGRVLTFTTGPCAGVSTRITRYVPGTPPTFCVEAPHNSKLPAANDSFLINGAPFNGTGFGFDSTAFNLTQTAAIAPTALGGSPAHTALLPHFGGYPTGGTNPMFYASQYGGPDESQDSPDNQNMFLAMVPPGRATGGALPVLPSFHRPELLPYWASKMVSPYVDGSGVPDVTNADTRNFLRQFIFRPMPWDHPNFTGSNPAMNTAANALVNMSSATGVWDVDNDNDGVPDSIWIDPGLPIITTPDGRRIKRLAAILVKDLDGRINVNVHGSISQYFPTAGQETHRTGHTVTFPYFAGQSGAGSPLYLPRGFGYGPAEVDFQNILGGTGALTAYQNIIQGRHASRSETSPFAPGIAGNDPLSQFRNFDMPSNHTTTYNTVWASPPDVWGRGIVALDYFGQPLYGFDADLATGETTDDPYEVQFDHTRAFADSPYQPRELERLLRYHDRDAQSLDSRLLYPSVTGGVLGSNTTVNERPGEVNSSTTTHPRREMLSTIGSYIPVPPGVLMKEQRSTFGTGPVTTSKFVGGAGYNTILDLYHSKIGNNPNTFYTLVPFEMRHGELFNINRPFGNGRDDNGNGIADDTSELGVQEAMPPPNGPVEMEKFNDSHGPTADPRQIYARHLYCLMMLLKDSGDPIAAIAPWRPRADLDGNGSLDDVDVNGDTVFDDQDTAQLIAQWAINVVDFRDADAIMTPFEYDINPFDGWQVDGNLTTDDGTTSPEVINGVPLTTPSGQRRVVWGVERPELLITETLAFHDRRTEDLTTEQPNPMEMAENTMSNPAENFDQRLRPQGSCFIELYNPWHDATATATNNFNGMRHLQEELYTQTTVSGSTVVGVNLDRMAGGFPVWRMLVLREASVSNNKFHPANTPVFRPDINAPNDNIQSNEVLRAVYFAEPTNLLGGIDSLVTDDRKIFYSSQGRTIASPTSNLSLLGTGQYAVIGSSGYTEGSNYITYAGRRTSDATDDDFWMSGGRNSTRQIVLTPGQQLSNGNTASVEFQVRYNRVATNEIVGFGKSPIAVPINVRGDGSSRSFNVSEPLQYPAADPLGAPFAATASNPEGEYVKPFDDPADKTAFDAGDNDLQVHNDGTFANARTVLLQRLANPTIAWNSRTNPYITIDRSSIDVTSFNGLKAISDPTVTNITPNRNFQSFQRGGSHPSAAWENSGSSPDEYRQLWPFTVARVDNPTPSPPEPGVVGPHNYAREMLHTLGFLNSRYGTPISGAVAYSGAPQPQAVAAPLPEMYMSFPWLTFHNRPFMNPQELMLVPATNQYGLLQNFSVRTALTTPPANYEYDNAAFNYPFGHLLNFFQSSSTAGAAPQFCRLFDFVNVPSPYLQADTFYNAAQFTSGGTYAANPANTPFSYRPPFQKLSRFRDPGRVNINTVFDDSTSTAADGILKALFKSNPSMDPSNVDGRGNGTLLATNLRKSRQGNDDATVAAYTADQDYPSMFYSPFRAQDAADLSVGGAITAAAPVSAGFLRPQTTAAAPSGEPLLAYHSIGLPGGGATSYDHEDTNRNPYFRYQRYQKAGNLLSTQSNCFAVWITIGYFELEDYTPPAPDTKINAARPEGLALGQEAGVDSGQAVRHRAFFMIDRSIPVGFLPGSKLNTDDCVLIRRMIE
jgi:hypothetical protein